MATNLHEQFNQYITGFFAEEDAVLKHIQAEAQRHELPRISIQAHEGRLLQFLAQMIGAKRILEIGTLAGYSAVWLARALPDDGKLITLEVSSKHAAIARAHFDYAGLSHKVDVRQGQAMDLLRKLEHEAPFDMVFIDADKVSYGEYLNWAANHIRIGGLISAHNAFRNGQIFDPQSLDDKAMVEFNRQLAKDERLNSFILAIGDGLAVALRQV